jgi:PLAC8 family
MSLSRKMSSCHDSANVSNSDAGSSRSYHTSRPAAAAAAGAEDERGIQVQHIPATDNLLEEEEQQENEDFCRRHQDSMAVHEKVQRNQKTTKDGRCSPCFCWNECDDKDKLDDDDDSIAAPLSTHKNNSSRKRKKKSRKATTGKWKSGLFGCFDGGLCNKTYVWHAWLCPQIVVMKLLVRMNMMRVLSIMGIMTPTPTPPFPPGGTIITNEDNNEISNDIDDKCDFNNHDDGVTADGISGNGGIHPRSKTNNMRRGGSTRLYFPCTSRSKNKLSVPSIKSTTNTTAAAAAAAKHRSSSSLSSPTSSSSSTSTTAISPASLKTVRKTFRRLMFLVVALTVYDALMAPPLFEFQIDDKTGELILISNFFSSQEGGVGSGTTSSLSTSGSSDGLTAAVAAGGESLYKNPPPFIWHQFLYVLLSFPMTIWGVWVVVKLRESIRSKYGIPITYRWLGRCEDLVCVLFCNCCVLSQMARQMSDDDDDDDSVDSNPPKNGILIDTDIETTCEEYSTQKSNSDSSSDSSTASTMTSTAASSSCTNNAHTNIDDDKNNGTFEESSPSSRFLLMQQTLSNLSSSSSMSTASSSSSGSSNSRNDGGKNHDPGNSKCLRRYRRRSSSRPVGAESCASDRVATVV